MTRVPRRATAFLLAALSLAGGLSAEDASKPTPAGREDKPALESGFVIGPSVRLLYASVDGDSFADRNAAPGTTLGFGDLGVDESKPLLELGLVLGWWEPWSPSGQFRYHFDIRYLGGSFEDRATFAAPATYDGVLFPAGRSVKSTFDFDLTQILVGGSWRWGTDARYAEAGIFVGTAILGARLEMESTAGESAHEGLRLGTLGIGTRFTVAPCGWFDVGGEAGFYGWWYDDNWRDKVTEEASIVDLSIHASVRPWRYAAIEVGYRYLNNFLHLEHTDEDYLYTGEREERKFFWTVQGPYVGATIRF